MAFRSPHKRRFAELQSDLDGKVYKFRILLPNGTSTGLTLHEPNDEMLLKEFVYFIRKEFMKTGSGIPETKRLIKWDGDIYLEDMFEKEIRKRISFSEFEPNKLHILRLHDGLNEAVNTFENMWDLTPVTELLSEFPSEYTFETSLADLIDNSLQAVWSNGPGERRLICVRVDKNKISIFDTGPGMDCSDDNSIVKWGRMGSSNHRASRPQAVGGSPPYLMPFFGMFGYGGPVAAMHLGRRAIVSSKSKKSRKVYTLLFEREALISKSGSDWRTNGGIRDPLESEMEMSPHGSFTKVKILEPKLKCLEPFQLQCRLKDIYFPYIQCDDAFDTGKTMTPIEFQVNGINLAEIEGGEVATTNLHSCNGREFVLQVKFQIKKDAASSRNPGSPFEANARLKCVYFPISEGQESFERILEKLNAEGCKIEENFEKFSRVSIRRLGRLLPDARWAMLPFMDMKLKKGDKAQVLKRCCWRVKCFIDADAGFCPTPSKTDLAHHDPYTVALKNFGNKTFSKESEIAIIIQKGGKPSSPSQVEKDYIDWVLKMHEEYDEEIDRGEDQPVLVVNPSNKKALGISSDVVRVHQVISRKGVLWKSGQNIKILKGAVGCHKNNLYATLEFILLEGFQGDVGGEARLICRPLGCSKENGCMLKVDGDSASLDIQDALSFPISVIDSGKCQVVDTVAWNSQLDRREQQKVPCIVTILSAEQCHQLQIDGELPIDAPISAGRLAPEKVVAVIRPASCTSSSSPVLDQKYIIVDDLGMSLEIKYVNESKNFKDAEIIAAEIIAAETLNVSSHRGVQGLYIFPLRSKFPRLFHRAGTYFFSLSVISADSSYKNWEAQVLVQPSPAVKWGLKSDIFGDDKSVVVRIGERIPRLSIICFDVYHNCVPFTRIHGVKVKIKTKDGSVLLQIDKISADLSQNKMSLEIKDLLIETSKLDLIRPSYYATLEVSSLDNLLSVTASCKVFPGGLHSVRMKETLKPESELVPGSLIEELCLEVLDIYGNHVEKGVVINLMVDGLHFLDNAGSIDSIRQVDDQGNVNLSGLLKVTQRYGGTVHLYVYSGGTKIWEKQFRVTERQLRVASGVPGSCAAGSVLENVVFEIVDYGGIVDEKIHGQFHTLAITSDSSNISDTVRYIFQHGKCRVPNLPVPQGQSRFCFAAFHSGHPELHIDIEILVIQTPKLEIVPLTEPDRADTNLVISPCSDHRVLATPSSTPCSPNEIRSLGHFLMSDQMELEKSLGKVRLHVETHKSKLQLLYEQNGSIQREIYDLQASAKTQQLEKFDCLMNAKEQIVQNIKQKGDTAAAVLCQLIQLPQKDLMKDVVDLVALLGTVSSIRLSRILAEYLGEDLMLAVVCMSFEAANAIERYCENGNIDRTFGLYEVACKLGRTIKGRYTGICLEHIRPFKGGFKGNDPQRKLILPDPILTPGKIPPGFMGYAVNLIDLDIQHLSTRTKAGYGLRETLFYHLFNEVQVYRTREDMKRANVCIKSGAVSLDGGIIKGNCVIAFGDCLSREPKIIFPVVKPEVPRHLSKNCGELVTKISTKMAELESVRVEIAEEEEAYDRSLIKYSKIEKKFQKFIREKGPFLNGFVLDYKADII